MRPEIQLQHVHRTITATSLVMIENTHTQVCSPCHRTKPLTQQQTQTSAYDTWCVSAQCAGKHPHTSSITALGWCVHAVSYSTGHALLTPPPPTVPHEEKKTRSCHGSWTPAGMHINILQRDTGERNGVKFYHLLQPELLWAFISVTWNHITEWIQTLKLNERCAEKCAIMRSTRINSVVAMRNNLWFYCWYFC